MENNLPIWFQNPILGAMPTSSWACFEYSPLPWKGRGAGGEGFTGTWPECHLTSTLSPEAGERVFNLTCLRKAVGMAPYALKWGSYFQVVPKPVGSTIRWESNGRARRTGRHRRRPTSPTQDIPMARSRASTDPLIVAYSGDGDELARFNQKQINPIPLELAGGEPIRRRCSWPSLHHTPRKKQTPVAEGRADCLFRDRSCVADHHGPFRRWKTSKGQAKGMVKSASPGSKDARCSLQSRYPP
jgi:hypothetical protein